MSLATAESSAKLTAMVEFAEFIGKVGIVGETSTAILAQALAAEITAAQASLSQLASSAQQAHGAAKNHQQYREKALLQVERVGLELAKFLETGAVNDATFEALQRSQARFQTEAQRHWSEEIKALRTASKEINRFMAEALRLLIPISDSSAKLLIAVRHELGQETDETQLLKSMQSYRDATFQRLHELISKIDAQREEEERAAQGTA